MVPPAPEIFFTTMGWGQSLFLRIESWKIRTNTSLPPPAAKGTITVIGLLGKVSSADKQRFEKTLPTS
jgi:hypothetical protein